MLISPTPEFQLYKRIKSCTLQIQIMKQFVVIIAALLLGVALGIPVAEKEVIKIPKLRASARYVILLP